MADTISLADAVSSGGQSIQLGYGDPDPLLGRQVGGYIVESPIGEGGTGLVYRARHPILNRRFAVKVLRPEAAADVTISSSFEREARTLSTLKHPHIIDIVGFGTLPDGRQYMVMEFVKGRTLQDELNQDGKIEVGRALKLADQILDGLEAAHSAGVIHRDIKPSNVLIATMSGGSELLKLLDFGIAVHASMDAGVEIFAGTPEYIAPEQVRGKSAGKQSDLYSFGVLLFEMLTGRQPFRADEADRDPVRSLLRMHVHTPAPSITTVCGDTLPSELEQLVGELLRKDPAERPSSAATVRSRLQKVQRSLRRPSSLMTRMLELPLPEPAALPVPAPVSPKEASSLWGRSAPGAGAVVLLAASALVLASIRDSPPAPVPSAAFAKGPAVVGPAICEQRPVTPAPTPPARVRPGKEPRAAKPVTLDAGSNVKPRAAARPSVVRRTGCEPTDHWRERAGIRLQELQQVAAASSDSSAWAEFEAIEPSISVAIGAAATAYECDRVERDLERLVRRIQ